MTNDPMVLLWTNGSQQSSRNIILWAAPYDAVRQWTIIHIQVTKREYSTILHQNKLISDNDVTTRNNPDSSLGIYLTATKVAQCRLVSENRRYKEEAKKETAKKTASLKLCLQKMDLKIFRNAKTPRTAYFCLPTNNQCSSNLLTCHWTPSITPLHTPGVILATSQIRERKK